MAQASTALRRVADSAEERPVAAPTPHVVVVDDEADLRETVADYLQMKGLRVSTAAGGAALRQILRQSRVDLVVLDISMPEEDGLSITRFLKADTDVAIVMLTASGEVVDRIVGLEMGADDYLGKPVDMRELLARIKAVLRRGAPREVAGTAAAPAGRTVRFGACTLDMEAHRLFDRNGDDIAITAMEFDLLKAFADHPNRVLTRDQLLDLAHNRGWEPFDRSIDIRIARLRRKIEPDCSKPQIIRTVRGSGYLFAGERN